MITPVPMNSWKRKGIFYVSDLVYQCDKDGYTVRVHRKLDFIAYHLIKWIHGEEKLIEMANKRVLR